MKRLSNKIRWNVPLAYLFIVMVTLSCSKKDECPYGKIDHLGRCTYDIMNVAQMTINDAAIEDHVMPFGTLLKEKNIVSINISSLYVHSESKRWETLIKLSLLEIPFEVGKHYGLEIQSFRDSLNTFNLIYLNIDALTAVFELDPEWEDSYVEITEKDEINQIVNGRYDIKFIKPTKFAQSWPPDKVHITGQFKTKYRIN